MDLVDLAFIAVRVVVVFFGLLIAVMLIIWMERKVIADMQTRIGPSRAGPWGILITLADGMKLFFKEGITPTDADRPVYLLAPTVALVPAFLAFAVIPFGTGVTIAGHYVPFQVANLDVGVLWVLAMGSLGVYGVVLAGWSSGSRYPLLGAIRSTAQMISYEVGMGLALVSVIMWTGTLSLNRIVEAQASMWNVIPMFPAFIVYVISSLAETNRPPFDLAEAESELVAGFHTEYSGIKFAMFFMAEYVNTVTVAAIAVTLFLGGWQGPAPEFLPWLWPLLWFFGKLVALIFVFIWIRATLPRIRYDRLMSFGWKVLIPFGLYWILATGAVIVLPERYARHPIFVWVAVFAGALLVLSFLWPSRAPAAIQTADLATPPRLDREVTKA